MTNRQCIAFVVALDDASATVEEVGGKGASLARMAAAGLPVPPGFHITTAAYCRFITENWAARADHVGCQESDCRSASDTTSRHQERSEAYSRRVRCQMRSPGR